MGNVCGFAGGISHPPNDFTFFDTILSPRGPHGRGVWSSASAWLYHRRLAVIDPQDRSGQPFETADGKWQTVYNGMVYNFNELMAQHARRTTGDTEVVAELFADRCVNVFKLEGMFAVALCRSREPYELRLARDSFGIKPLYTRSTTEGLLFSSQARCLAVGEQPPAISQDAIASFLRFGCVTTGTMFEGVDEFPAGGVLERDGKSTTYMDNPAWSTNHGDRNKRLPDLLRTAVRSHLRSDIPICLLLSGGLDSAIIAALADSENLTALTLSVPGGIDESARAARTARHYRLPYQQVPVDSSLALSAVDAFFDAQDQPSIDGFNTFLVCRAASEAGFNVALSGIGADELFGGYTSYRRVRLGMAVRHIPMPLVKAACRLIDRGSLPVKLSRALATRGDGTALHRIAREVFSPSEVARLTGGSTGDALLPGEEAWLQRSGDPTMAGEISLYLQKMLLRDGDAQSMASAVELRVPFLTREVVRAALSISPVDRAIRGKRVLVDALDDPFIESVHKQPKTGFRLPIDEWLDGSLGALEQEALDDSSALSNYVDVDEARQMLARPGSWARRWALVALDQWLTRNATTSG